ncbi:HD domain-containing protein [Parasporobacterium paucivorans]|uniref:HD domain-containing protein n=1 Tax=Parasporobacterium paucivorans DSM 15970 TaxID=1122934 RepID=A0A1M6HVS0_9FIRM|nr:HD domain-containing protein [Parasporobacterium paucivorans]SHJ26208.1 HD domain-containing protein [Parasporobacterium paucivorans DSM 15970]
MNQSAKVMEAMIGYFEGDIRRINHLVKVYAFAKTIGELEGLDQKTQEILEIAAITHDIGIKISEEKYHSSSGHYQQLEGPNEAKILLENLGTEAPIIERVCWLIAHHHTYKNIDTSDYQILVESDFLVNAWEDEMNSEAVENVKSRIFRTKSGTSMLDSMYKRRV